MDPEALGELIAAAEEAAAHPFRRPRPFQTRLARALQRVKETHGHEDDDDDEDGPKDRQL